MYKIQNIKRIDSCCTTWVVEDKHTTFVDPIPNPKLLATILASGAAVKEIGVDELPYPAHKSDPRLLYNINNNKEGRAEHIYGWLDDSGVAHYLGASSIVE